MHIYIHQIKLVHNTLANFPLKTESATFQKAGI